MVKKKQLISTCLSAKIKKDSDCFFLGSWCFEKITDVKKNSFLKDRWFKNKIIKKDYKYLQNLFKRVTNTIPEYLNNYHNLKYPNHFWKYLLWIWFSHYLCSMYYRWKTVEAATKKNKILEYHLNIPEQKICFNKTYEYIYFLSSSDFYNEYLFSKIIKKFKKKINLIKTKKKFLVNKKNYYRNYRNSFKYSLARKITNFISNLFFRKNTFLINGGFSFKNIILLYLKNFTLPFFIDEQFEKPFKMSVSTLSKDQENKRKKTHFNFLPKNTFEKFLTENLIFDIPFFFIEKFKENISNLKKIEINPKLIISGKGHMDNDNYRLWILLKKFLNKTNITIIKHGGDHVDLSWDQNSEREISKKYFSWHTSENKKKFPVSKYIGLKEEREASENLLYVGYEIFKYQFRIDRSVLNLEDLESTYNLKLMSLKLKNKIFKKLNYCEKHFFDDRNYQEIKKIIGKDKIKKSGSFKTQLSKAKLVICDYPQTTFLESVLSGPTILITNYKKNWPPQDNMKKIYESLKNMGILFENPNDAVSFINKEWENIDNWWQSEKIQKERSNLLKSFNINTSQSGLNKWSTYISQNI